MGLPRSPTNVTPNMHIHILSHSTGDTSPQVPWCAKDVLHSAACPQRPSKPEQDLFTKLDLPASDRVCNSNLLQCLCPFLTCLLPVSTKNTEFYQGCRKCQKLCLPVFAPGHLLRHRAGRKVDTTHQRWSTGKFCSFSPPSGGLKRSPFMIRKKKLQRIN